MRKLTTWRMPLEPAVPAGSGGRIAPVWNRPGHVAFVAVFGPASIVITLLARSGIVASGGNGPSGRVSSWADRHTAQRAAQVITTGLVSFIVFPICVPVLS